jgi:peptidoglycan/xylan/chitin deacetylase (PgdA/CDA1 family)
MKKIFSYLAILFLLTLSSCGQTALALFATETPLPTMTPTATQTFTPSPTATFTITPSPTETPTPQPTSTPVLVLQGPGVVICPILLYHQIEVPSVPNPYFTTPDDFRAQMQALKDWGYIPITTTQLYHAIVDGAYLPERPIVITFDDGDVSVYDAAFPIMQEFGFVGVNYIVSSYVGVDGYMTIDQIRETVDAGWEVGSHTMSHPNLTEIDSSLYFYEIDRSRADLEEWLGVEVRTLAYPFGGVNGDVSDRVHAAGYYAAMMQGAFVQQGPYNIYSLWRRPVDYGWDIATFGSFLPWNTPPQ